MGRWPRKRSERLGGKLLAIRQSLGITQSEMANRLDYAVHKRLSEFESGKREPKLLVLLRYAKVANVSVESLIDDEIELKF